MRSLPECLVVLVCWQRVIATNVWQIFLFSVSNFIWFVFTSNKYAAARHVTFLLQSSGYSEMVVFKYSDIFTFTLLFLLSNINIIPQYVWVLTIVTVISGLCFQMLYDLCHNILILMADLQVVYDPCQLLRKHQWCCMWRRYAPQLRQLLLLEVMLLCLLLERRHLPPLCRVFVGYRWRMLDPWSYRHSSHWWAIQSAVHFFVPC